MKIKRFNKVTVPSRILSAPTIRINDAGAMSFNKAAIGLLGLSANPPLLNQVIEGVEFIQDEEHPKDWYLSINTSEVALTPRAYKDALIIQNSVIAKTIIKSIAPGVTSMALLIGSVAVEQLDGEDLWPIITSSYKPKI